MSSLLEDESGVNAPEYTVSEISGAVRRVIEGEFGHVRVRGEVGRVSRPRSGHVYLDLKDENAVLASVIWRGVAARLEIQPEEGLEVVATGRLTTYPGQSRYQLVIESLRPAGLGALMAMLEKRKAKLAAEGLFDAQRKRPLPPLPRVIGVVTSPSGAVIRDILHRVRDRFPTRVVIWPVAVQGERCAPEVAAAVRGFNRLPADGPLPVPDVIIVARGGGSVEDLWGFNEEEVVRAVAESRIPVISAVGHETDTTLIDHAADRRAPTPTAAAEMAVPERLALKARVDELSARMERATGMQLDHRRQRLGDLARRLPSPERLLETQRQRLDELGALRLPQALRSLAQGRRLAFERIAARLSGELLRGRLLHERERLAGLAARARVALEVRQTRARERFGALSRRLDPALARRPVTAGREGLARAARRLDPAITRLLAERRRALDALARMHRQLGWRETLARGYAVVWHGAQPVTAAAEARRHPALEIEFHDGRVPVTTATSSGGGGRRRVGGGGRGGGDAGTGGGQGSLF